MSPSPLRSAFWTLTASIGLSVSLLAISSIFSRSQTPPPVSFASGNLSLSAAPTLDSQAIADNDEFPYSSGDHSDWPPYRSGFAPDGTNHNTQPGVAASGSMTDPAESVGPLVPLPVDIPESPRIPVNAVSHSDSSPLAIGFDEVLQPASGRGAFFELPPPPEFWIGTIDPSRLSQSQTSTPVEKLIARLQRRFDGLDNELEGLHGEFDDLHSRFAEELATVQSSHHEVRDAISNLVEVTVEREEIPPPLRFDMTVLVMPLRGAAREGGLTLISRESPEISLSFGPEIADGTRWATSRTDTDTFDVWFRNRAHARFQRHSEFHLEEQSATEIDLSQPIGPAMIQARGSQIRERIITLPWDGLLTMRASTRPSGLINVELQVRSSAPTGADDHWKQATLVPDGTLILTVVLDEIHRPLISDSSGSIDSDSNQAVPRRSSTTELIVLLQPLASTTPAANPSINSRQAPLSPGE